MSFKKFEFAEQVLGFIVSEKLDVALVKEMHKVIDEALEKFDSISLYVEDNTDENVDMKALFEDFSYRMNNNSEHSRIAIVSDKQSVAIYTNVKAVFMKAKMRHFPLKSRMEALNWVSAIYTHN
ncbi:MAG: STAS/SEC14 domain-containing protein [Leeuwenhoekiella sp.]